MRIGMGRCLEMMQFHRKDLETMAENLETLEGTVSYCQASNAILIHGIMSKKCSTLVGGEGYY
jgi:hypothetical protein